MCVCVCVSKWKQLSLSSLLARYVIQQVPSVKLFRRGMMFPYQGPAQTNGAAGEGNRRCPTREPVGFLVRLYHFPSLPPPSLPPSSPVSGLVQYLKEEIARHGLEENPIITLTNENFDDIIDSSELILVEFYTDM